MIAVALALALLAQDPAAYDGQEPVMLTRSEYDELVRTQRLWNEAFPSFGGQWASDPAQAVLDGTAPPRPGCIGLNDYLARIEGKRVIAAQGLEEARVYEETFSGVKDGSDLGELIFGVSSLLRLERETTLEHWRYVDAVVVPAIVQLCSPSRP